MNLNLIVQATYTQPDKLTKEALKNLEFLVALDYKNICMNYSDFYTFTSIPWIEKIFYRTRGTGRLVGREHKMGFFHGRNAAWIDHNLQSGYIKISNKLPDGNNNVWSEEFDFRNENSISKIAKTMKLKAFW